jgi:hypothetical protein
MHNGVLEWSSIPALLFSFFSSGDGEKRGKNNTEKGYSYDARNF